MNTCMIIGRLGRDVELRYTPNGSASARFSIAHSRKWKDREGNQQEKTSWINVQCYGKTAEDSSHLKKGQQCMVAGPLEVDEYEKNGQRQWYTYVKANIVRRVEYTDRDDRAPAAADGVPGPDDDIPF